MRVVSKATATIDKAQRQAELEAGMAAEARLDVAKCAEFTLRAEKTGMPIHLEDGHREMLEICQKHPRIVIIAAPRLGKTTLITYMLQLWRLGRNPNTYSAKVGSATKTNAIRHTRQVRTHIESNRRLRLVFPGLRQGDKWTEEEWEVARSVAGPGSKESSCIALGDMGQYQGFRTQDDFFDDMVDPTISASRYLCEKQAEWVMDMESRVENAGQRFFIQNCFRRWDTGHILAEKFGWYLYLMPALDNLDRTLYPVIWTQPDCDKYAPARKDQDLRCIPKREGDSEFQEAWIQRCIAQGEGLTLEAASNGNLMRQRGAVTVTGVDLASRKGKKSDETVLFTVIVAPPEYFGVEGYSEGTRMMRVLNIERRKMFAPEIKRAIVDHWRRYQSVFCVENVSAQAYIQQMLAVEHPEIPIMPFTTSAATKAHPEMGLSSLANEMSMGLWVIPSYREAGGEVLRTEDRVTRWVDELRIYDPESHLPDSVAAMWFARIGARRASFGHDVGEAGDPLTKEELLAAGFSIEQIRLAFPELVPVPRLVNAQNQPITEVDKIKQAAEDRRRTAEQENQNHLRQLVRGIMRFDDEDSPSASENGADRFF